jgi:hypothetical protein
LAFHASPLARTDQPPNQLQPLTLEEVKSRYLQKNEELGHITELAFDDEFWTLSGRGTAVRMSGRLEDQKVLFDRSQNRVTLK